MHFLEIYKRAGNYRKACLVLRCLACLEEATPLTLFIITRDNDGAWIPVASAPLMAPGYSPFPLALLACHTQLPGQERQGGCSLATRDLRLRVNDLLKNKRFCLVTLMQELLNSSENWVGLIPASKTSTQGAETEMGEEGD